MKKPTSETSGNDDLKKQLGIDFYQNVLDDCGFGIICYDLKGTIIYLNRIAAENVGLEIEDMIDKPAFSVFGKELGDLLNQRIQEVKEKAETVNFEDDIDFNGINKRYLSRCSPIKDDKNDLIGVQIVSADITAQNNIEKDLIQKNQFINSILDNLPIGLAVNKIREGTATYMNRKFEEIYGWPEEIIKNIEKFFEHVYPDPAYRKKIMDRVFKDIESGDPDKMNWQKIEIRTSKNEKKIIDAKNIPLFDQNLMISTVQDVTDREEALGKLKESEMRYRLLVETSPYIIIIHDLTGKIKYANPATFELLEWVKKKNSEFSIAAFLPEDELNELLKRKKKRTEGDRGKFIYEIQVKKPSGENIYLEVISRPIFREGEIEDILLVARDITEKKKADIKMEKKVTERTAELTEKNQQLEKMNKLFVGREFRIKELRDKIQELEIRLREKDA